MEEEEQDKGPTIEDIFSAISKTKSKFGMVNVPLPPKRRFHRSEKPAVNNFQEKISGADKNVSHQFDTSATCESTSSHSKPEIASSQILSSRLNSDYGAHKIGPKFQTPSHTQSKCWENSRSNSSQIENIYGEVDFLVKGNSSTKSSTFGPLSYESERMVNKSPNKIMPRSISASDIREKNEKEQHGLEKNWGRLRYKEEGSLTDHGRQCVKKQYNPGISRHDVEDDTYVDLSNPSMSTMKMSEQNRSSISQGNSLTINTLETEKQSIVNSILKDRETQMQTGELHSYYATAGANTRESLASLKKMNSDMLEGSSGYQSQNMASLNDNGTTISKSSCSEKRSGTAVSKSLPLVDRNNASTYKNTSSQSRTEIDSSQSFSSGISSDSVPKVDPKFQITSHTRSKWKEDSRSDISQTENSFGKADILVKGHRYMTLGTLGTGGSSVVYEVVDLESKKVRALKIVNIINIDEATLEGYKNEIAILERLQWSDRVITLYEYEQTPTQLKIVLEKGNKDLASLLNSRHGKGKQPTLLSPFTIRHYWHGMLKAVQAIHTEGIIHSDLKPANFLLVCPTVKLIDFGIASSIQQDMTSVFKDSQAGTYNYMSPESLRDIHSGPIINGKAGSKPIIKIGVKSDVWSLGCILYNMVYGKTPFQHIGNPIMKLAAISNPNSKISFPVIENKLLLDTLKKCLQFDPKARPSIEELLEHPYLNEDVQEKDQAASPPASKEGLGSVIQQLQCLTPNSLSQVTKMVEKLKKEPQETVASQMRRNLVKDL
ncbi:dual specificity protein kinase monopolar spindle 1 [Oratosquilla oratoria]|uniref:dual specificity protein kinase monopolar spindle 1 n=1 Tax=Oratosquilla oratoria TaxID=337810 RepID=UPI003F7584E5